MPVSKREVAARTKSHAITFAKFTEPYWSEPGALLYLGDVREQLRLMPARSVQCVVTSPPYWGLRDYAETAKFDEEVEAVAWATNRTTHCNIHQNCGGTVRFINKGASRVDVRDDDSKVVGYVWVGRVGCESLWPNGQWHSLGAESSPDCGTCGKAQCGACFVCAMVSVFREVWRVLRDDGTLWLNLGDTYGQPARWGGKLDVPCKQQTNVGTHSQHTKSNPETNLADGNLVGIPWRVSLAIQADGWVLRNDIIWYSPNKMPESVTDRCSKSHEYIFLLTKGMDYYYDAVAIQDDAKSAGRIPGGNHKVDTSRNDADRDMSIPVQPLANKRDVWVVPSTGYPGAHFATFSPRLITPCILAGTSEHGCCAECGRSYERVTVTDRAESRTDGAGGNGFGSRDTLAAHAAGAESKPNWRQPTGTSTLGWRKVCGCRTDEVVPCVVLDPFVGSGTTVATSLQLGRFGVGIDLSEVYLKDHAIPRSSAALCGESVSRKSKVVTPDVVPPPQRMR